MVGPDYYTLLPTRQSQQLSHLKMRLFLRSNINFRSLGYSNRYPKSYQFGSKLTNAQDIFNHSIFQASQHYSLRQTPLNNFKKPAQSNSSPHSYTFNSSPFAEEHAHPPTKPSSKARTSKNKTKKAKSEHSQEDKQRNFQEFERSMSNIMGGQVSSEYPALNYLSEAFRANLTQQTPSENLLKGKNISAAERDQNAVEFMKIVGHSMPKESSSRIIQMIEKHCDSVREEEDLLGQLAKGVALNSNGSRAKKDKKQQKLLDSIKKNLEKELTQNQCQTEKNAAFIKKLVASFKKTNPFRITMKAFEQNYPPEEAAYDPEKHIEIKMVSSNQIFKQRQSVPDPRKEADSQLYAYVYDLPYALTEEESAELINYLQITQDIKVQSFAIFPFKNVMENKQRDIVFQVPDNYKEEGRMEKVYNTIKIENLLSKSKKKEKKNKIDMDYEEDEVAFQLPPSNADFILSKMKTESFLKYNKSSMIIKFSTVQDKDKIVTPATRLFGLTYKSFENIKFQSASRKNVITLSGIPVGCNSTKLIEALNSVLTPEGIPLQVQEDSYLSKHYVNISFNYFTDSLKALTLLNNLEFEEKRLKTQIKYGPIKLDKGEESRESMELVRKVMDIREQYYSKFAFEDQKLKF